MDGGGLEIGRFDSFHKFRFLMTSQEFSTMSHYGDMLSENLRTQYEAVPVDEKTKGKKKGDVTKVDGDETRVLTAEELAAPVCGEPSSSAVGGPVVLKFDAGAPTELGASKPDQSDEATTLAKALSDVDNADKSKGQSDKGDCNDDGSVPGDGSQHGAKPEDSTKADGSSSVPSGAQPKTGAKAKAKAASDAEKPQGKLKRQKSTS